MDTKELSKAAGRETRSRTNIERLLEAVQEFEEAKNAAEEAVDIFAEMEEVSDTIERFKERLDALAGLGLYSPDVVAGLDAVLELLNKWMPGDVDELQQIVDAYDEAYSAAESANDSLDTDGYTKDDRDDLYTDAIGHAANLVDAIDGAAATANMRQAKLVEA